MLKDTVRALREVILSATASNGGKAHEPSATEYFALISSTLGTSMSLGVAHTSDLLRILVGVMDNTSKSVLRSQFRSLSKTITEGIIGQYMASQDPEEIQLVQLALRAQVKVHFTA